MPDRRASPWSPPTWDSKAFRVCVYVFVVAMLIATVVSVVDGLPRLARYYAVCLLIGPASAAVMRAQARRRK